MLKGLFRCFVRLAGEYETASMKRLSLYSIKDIKNNVVMQTGYINRAGYHSVAKQHAMWERVATSS